MSEDVARAESAAVTFLRAIPRAGATKQEWAEWRAGHPATRLAAELRAARWSPDTEENA